MRVGRVGSKHSGLFPT